MAHDGNYWVYAGNQVTNLKNVEMTGYRKQAIYKKMITFEGISNDNQIVDLLSRRNYFCYQPSMKYLIKSINQRSGTPCSFSFLSKGHKAIS